MTPAQAAWLRKLRATGWVVPVGSEWRVDRRCRYMGWTHQKTGDWPRGITPDGLAALAEYEEKAK